MLSTDKILIWNISLSNKVKELLIKTVDGLTG